MKEKTKREILKVAILLTVHLLSVAPSILVFVYLHDMENRWLYLLIVTSAVISIPAIYAISVALLNYSLPQIPEGKYLSSSKEFTYWLSRTLNSENILNSNYINNFVNRTWIIRFIVYNLMGMKKVSGFGISPNVKLLDPDKIYIGKGTFIGTNTIISAHMIINHKPMLEVVLANVNIGENCIIGAQCSIGPGTTISNGSNIDLHVAISSHVNIGENTIILAGTMICNNVDIGNNVRIGKGCMIGTRVLIEDDVSIGNFVSIAFGVHIRSGEKVEELGRVSLNS